MKKIYNLLITLGINPVRMYRTIVSIPYYIQDYFKLLRQRSGDDFPLSFYPILDDRAKQGGSARGHYFHQDLLVAQKIFKNKPEKHFDIGSRVDGFVAHVASFREISVIDIRETTTKVNNIEFLKIDMMKPEEQLTELCDSLSCLHALEHFGLGRYGDPVDYNGHVKGIRNMHKILKGNGKLYLSVPIGKQRIEFNAHRVFSVEYLLKTFSDIFSVESFSFVDDAGDLHSDVVLTEQSIDKYNSYNYACGIFELVKK